MEKRSRQVLEGFMRCKTMLGGAFQRVDRLSGSSLIQPVLSDVDQDTASSYRAAGMIESDKTAR
jgi:hypothetical protein